MGDPGAKENSDVKDGAAKEEGVMDEEEAEEWVEEVRFDEDEDVGDDDLAEQAVADLGEMDLENYDGTGEEDDEGATGPPEDDAISKFVEHKGSVFCVATDPKDGALAVTGGEDDKAFVWKISDGSIVMECTGHKDSVTCASFSHDSVYVATADMSGLVKVWKIATAQEIWSFETSDLEWMEWHHLTHVLLVGTADGDTWMFKIPSGDVKTFQSHGETSTIGKIMPDGKRACVGYQDGMVKIWDLKAGSTLHSITGHLAHQESITCIDCHQDNTLILTGSTDVSSKLISTTTGKVLTTFNCSSAQQEGQVDDSVEAVGFAHNTGSAGINLAATGTLTGNMTIWDLSTQVSRHTCQHEAGIVRLRWDKTRPLIYTGTLDGVVNLWDTRTAKRERQWFGHLEEILDLDITSDGKFIVTAAGDGSSRVFSIDQSQS